MFERRRFRRGCLLPIVVALVVAMICAFGSASTSATAEPGAASAKKATFKVTGVEAGVTATVYKYMEVTWDAKSEKAKSEFDSKVASWATERFPGYVEGKLPKLEEKDSGERSKFFGPLLVGIAEGKFNLTEEFVAASGGGSNAEIDFSLSMGGYVIKLSNGSSHVYQPIVASVCPKLDDAATDGGYKLVITKDFDPTPLGEIVAQGEAITITKKVNGQKEKTHGQIGVTVPYMIETQVPDYPIDAINKRFGVQDCSDPGLTIDQSTIQVKVGDKVLQQENGDYTLTHLPSGGGSSADFKVEFTDAQYSFAFQNNAGADSSGANRKLTVTYRATLNSNAPIENGVKNSVYPLIPKDYYSKTDTKYTALSSTPTVATVYTYGINITKVGDLEAGLQGAKFKLYKGDSVGGDEVKVENKSVGAAGEKEDDTTGMYVVAANSGRSTLPALPGAAVPPIPGSPLPTAIISGKEGRVQIDGLDAGTYTLQEIQPPAGYESLTNPVTIVIKDDEPDGKPDDSGSTINGQKATVDEDNRLSYTLKNTKTKGPEEQFDFTLPKTGAMGTAVFGALGVALVAVSVALVIVRRRKDKQSS